jgi:hypothetical protein
MSKLQREALEWIKGGGHIVYAPAGVFAYNADMAARRLNRNTFEALIRRRMIGVTSRTVAGSLARVRYDITTKGERLTGDAER